ncbi:MAG: hypothetical protein KBS52_06275 [Clostridiales bacterium]|nr:hypothetical protein [Candidatus Equinaster intestinalis]
MIDIHAHFLPQMDDGAESVDESLAMLWAAYQQGVTTVVATPHCIIHGKNSVNQFLKARKAAYGKIKKVKNLPDIILGAEVMMDHDLSDDPDVKKLCIENTDYMLIEFANMGIGVGETEFEYIYNLTLLGIKPIIAHIDRYPHSLRIMSMLGDLDVIFQVNAARFVSRIERKDVAKILKTGYSVVVASDMHNTKSRPCRMKEAHEMSIRHFLANTKRIFPANIESLCEM